MIGMFLSSIDSTAVVTAMPRAVSTLGGIELYSLVFSAYMIASTISMPVWGRLSDLKGRRSLYIAATFVFVSGTALCGTSRSMAQLIAFRILQGFGAGGVITLAMVIIGEIYSLKERARIQGLFGGVWAVSSILGPLAGGLITDHLNWRWVFYLNIPFGVTAAIIIKSALPTIKGPKAGSKMDYGGLAVLSLFLIAFMIAIQSIGNGKGVFSAYSLVTFAISGLLFILFLITEKRAESPVIPSQLVSNEYFRSSALIGFLIGMAMFGSITFIPLFFQAALGTTATRAGGVLTPLLLAWITVSSISGRLMLRFGFKPLVMTGTLLLTLGFFMFSTTDKTTTHRMATVYLVVVGGGMGMVFVPIILAVQNTVGREMLGIATSATQFFRSIGGAIGVSLMGAVMTTLVSRGLSKIVDGTAQGSNRFPFELMVDPHARGRLQPAVLDSYAVILAESIHYVFIASFIISLLAFLAAFLVPSGKELNRKRV
jgi:EmrB/QacA subfamily drug resistance transporter